MSEIGRDSLLAGEAPLAEGETLLAEWRADPRVYWQNHVILAAVVSLPARAVLWWIGHPHYWTGPLAAVVAVFARAAFLRSEALTDRWRLTGQRLLGPRGRVAPLTSIKAATVFLGDVLVTTHTGDRHLMKYLAGPGSAAARIEAAKGKR